MTETDTAGTYEQNYIYLAGRRFGAVGPNDAYLFYSDNLGSVRAITGETGLVCYSADFYPFGGEKVLTNNCPQPYYPFKFAAMERDSETGNDHTLNRQYSSSYGRWLSPDPAGKKAASLVDPQTWNMYSYVGDNPLTLTDPSGLIVQCSSSLNKKDAATCRSIIDTANQKDKNGNFVNARLHQVYQRFDDDKRALIISNAKLPGSEGAVFNVRQINGTRTDFASGTIQIDFAKIRSTSAVPASMVPGFTKYAGIAGDFGLKMAETFGHEGAHGVYALDNPFQAVSAQTLMNDSAEMLQMRAGSTNPEFLREQTAIGVFLNATETYAQQMEQTINQELNGGPDE